jgi:hypothetical protein
MGPIEEIDHAIQAWRWEARDKPILTYVLDHSYSEQNLSLANLKHGDFAKASVLFNVSSLPILEKGEQFLRVIGIFALLCSHYKIRLF